MSLDVTPGETIPATRKRSSAQQQEEEEATGIDAIGN